MTEDLYAEKIIQGIAGLRTQLLNNTPICVCAFLGVFFFFFILQVRIAAYRN